MMITVLSIALSEVVTIRRYLFIRTQGTFRSWLLVSLRMKSKRVTQKRDECNHPC